MTLLPAASPLRSLSRSCQPALPATGFVAGLIITLGTAFALSWPGSVRAAEPGPPVCDSARTAVSASAQAQASTPSQAPSRAPSQAQTRQTPRPPAENRRLELDYVTGGYEVQATPSGQAGWPLSVSYQAGVEWPHLILTPRRGSWDLSANGTLLLPLANPTDAPVDVSLRVGDDAAASWPDHAVAATFSLPARSQRVAVLALCALDSKQMGMRTGPPARPPTGLSAPAAVLTPDGRVDRTRIASLYLVVNSLAAGHRLLVGPLSAVPSTSQEAAYSGLIDEFGQSTLGQWPEKVRDLNDLQARAKQEAAMLTAAAKPRSGADREADPFGAWSDGRNPAPRFDASGFFRTQRAADGRWWLVTPQGQGFFSIGVDTVALHDGATYVEGRESMFTRLPAGNEPLAVHYGQSDLRAGMGAQAGRRFDHGRYFNFYTANLQRRHGADYKAAWITLTQRRLRAWGFNTLGNWSDPAFWRKDLAERLPYTVPLSIEGDYARVSDGVDYWGKMPDPFDPKFAQAVDRLMREQAAPRRDDPFLLGYFVDNELAWGNGPSPDPRQRYALAFNTLSQAAAGPAKQALFALLRERYDSVRSWREAWSLSTPSAAGQADRSSTGGAATQPNAETWETALQRPVVLPAAVPERVLADLSAFTRRFADRYYQTVADALKRHDPNHLYLGSRFAAQTDEAVGACDRYCDVVSFNIYHRRFALARRDRFRELTKPAMVGEFNFSSTDRGPFWPGLVDVGSEAQRGVAYADYLREAAADPQMVGVHWFQYLDEPASGRLLDGENAHFGLVSIADVPYGGFVEAVRAANRAAMTSRTDGGR